MRIVFVRKGCCLKTSGQVFKENAKETSPQDIEFVVFSMSLLSM